MDKSVTSTVLRTVLATLILGASIGPSAGQDKSATPATKQARPSTAALGAEPASAASMQAMYTAMLDRIEHSPFGKPLHLESVQASDTIRGDIVARVDHPFTAVRSALREMNAWCDILILHPNIQQCRTVGGGVSGAAGGGVSGAAAPSLIVQLGRAGHPVEFSFRAAASDADHLDVQLVAASGPLGTRDYRIRLGASPLDDRRTLMHLAFSHGYGARARFAMQAYLATFGQGKVGFTVVDRSADGQPVYVDDFRGALERNAMRYYLAIEAYLDSRAAPASEQAERRIRTWYASTGRYPTQLHEEPEYLDLKRRAIRGRMAATPAPAPTAQRGG